MDIELLPYVILMLAAIFAVSQRRNLSMVTALVATVIATVQGRVQPLGLVALLGLTLAGWLPLQPAVVRRPLWRWLAYAVFAALAIGLMNHALPGFNNLLSYDHVRFSGDAVPFTMYLNFDKTFVGLAICWFFLPSTSTSPRKNLMLSVQAWAVLIALLAVAAYATNFSRFEPKLPDGATLWMLNNLLFVCLAEEAFFRGFLQTLFLRAWPNARLQPAAAIGAAALLFGLAHFAGGPIYVVLAAVAGLVYGFVFWKTKRIEYPILVHFGLNAIHFFFFTYPALASTPGV